MNRELHVNAVRGVLYFLVLLAAFLLAINPVVMTILPLLLAAVSSVVGVSGKLCGYLAVSRSVCKIE